MKILKSIFGFFKKEMMLTVSLAAAVLSMIFISKPGLHTLQSIDWRTIVSLFMMLTVLEGFKKENLFRPLVAFAGRMKSSRSLAFFLVFAVFFSSMLVTNDISLIIFVPLAIFLFRQKREKYILPTIVLQNIAAVRGSMLTPFGSPQNLFVFSRSGVDAGKFILRMAPLSVLSGALLCVFIMVIFRDGDEGTRAEVDAGEWAPERRTVRILYAALFLVTVASIVSRSPYYPYVAVFVLLAVLIFDRKILLATDYVLLLTFVCFFIFSSAVGSHEGIASALKSAVSGREYWFAIILSQFISNVPAAIALYGFSENTFGLLYGLDTAGLCTVIGSLASVINYRIYAREFPGRGKDFLREFAILGLAFFALVALPGYYLSGWSL